jgi:predicted amidohydrolase YtcJ
MENKLGKLESGYKADLIILDTDPFSCPPDDIPGIKPSGTIIDGRWVIKNI